MKRAIRKLVNLSGFDVVRILKTNKEADMARYALFHSESLAARRFYNIGAGSFSHPYWTNIDYATEHYSGAQRNEFIDFNLMEEKPLPVGSDTAEIVYSSHTIEHISDGAVLNMLKQSYRILKPGGCIRLTTPDMLLEYKAYKRNDIDFWYWRNWYSQEGSWEKLYKVPLSEASIHQLFLEHFATQLSEISADDSGKARFSDPQVIEIFRTLPMEEGLDFFTKQCKYNSACPGNHINWWSQKKLISFLQAAGFSESYGSGYGQSLFPPLRNTVLFDSTHPQMSLYVEAIK